MAEASPQPSGLEPVLLVEEDGPVRIVRMNRPRVLNAIDRDLHHRLACLWREIAADREAKAIVLTGAGRAFSAGGDVEMMLEMQRDLACRAAILDEARAIVIEQLECPLPVVAAVNGPAIGLGCSLAILCDVVYMAESSYLADPHVAAGVAAGDGGAVFWPMIMGMARAKELLFTGDRITADEAVALHLANHVVPDRALLPDAVRFAHRLAGLPGEALRATKRTINLPALRAAQDTLRYALSEEFTTFDSAAHREFTARLQRHGREGD